MHVLQYIKGTLDFKITYGGEGHTSLAPIGYVDADYAGDIDSLALSTTEVEYMMTLRAGKQIEFMYSSINEVGYPQPRPATLYNNNAGAVSLAKNTKGNIQVKHIDIRHHYIRDLVNDRRIVIHHIPSTENLADIFTKPLGCVAHH